MKERWVGYLPALLLAGACRPDLWLDQRVQPEEAHENSPKDPDFLAEDFLVTRMNRDGTPRYAVKAKNWCITRATTAPRWISRSSPISIPKPRRSTMRADHRQVPTTARTRTSPAASWCAACLCRPEGDDAADQLSARDSRPGSRQTDREVTLTSGNSTVKSLGLEFNNATRSLKLFSQVRGTFETPAKESQLPMPWERRFELAFSQTAPVSPEHATVDGWTSTLQARCGPCAARCTHAEHGCRARRARRPREARERRGRSPVARRHPRKRVCSRATSSSRRAR